MGMYDYIKCEYPIDKEVQDKTFQTKSLYCSLEHYKIDKDGLLWKLDKVSPEEWVPICSTECIVFYTYIGSREKNTWRWYEYQTFFDKGKLISIEEKEKS